MRIPLPPSTSFSVRDRQAIAYFYEQDTIQTALDRIWPVAASFAQADGVALDSIRWPFITTTTQDFIE
jgi:hypothetical protein